MAALVCAELVEYCTQAVLCNRVRQGCPRLVNFVAFDEASEPVGTQQQATPGSSRNILGPNPSTNIGIVAQSEVPVSPSEVTPAAHRDLFAVLVNQFQAATTITYSCLPNTRGFTF